jgi:hypothetical protein
MPKTNKKNDVSTICNAIAQAVGLIPYDGALDEDNNPIEIGLKREEGHPIYDHRSIDSFNARISGKNLICSYQAQLQASDVYGKLEDELESTMSNIVKHLKKRYKQISGTGLRLKALGEVDARVDRLNKRCYSVVCSKVYEIGNLKELDDIMSTSSVEKNKEVENFLSDSSTKKPKNVTRKQA